MITDHQDDLGTFLRQNAPELAQTQFIKEASWVEKKDMLDRDFALILVEPNGREHRKLAMQDAGNTLASITYFLTKDHNLSDSAVKLAASNLLNSAMHYGLYDSFGDYLLHNEKLGSAFDVLAVLADTLDGSEIIDERRVAIKQANAGAGSYGAGQQGALSAAKTVKHHQGQAGMMGQPQAIGGQPQTVVQHKQASYDLIKEAQFMWPELDPVDKRSFSLIIKEAAEEEGASVPDEIYQYSGETLNPVFGNIMNQRQRYTANEDLQSDYSRLSDIAHAMPLEKAAEALYLIDEQAGLIGRYGKTLPDPVLAVYGTTKEASWSWNHGGDYCTARDLELLCHDPVKSKRFSDVFNEEICNSFKSDPVGEFEKRPVEQQIIIARMANTTSM